MPFRVPEKYRVVTGEYRTTPAHGNNGSFLVPMPPPSTTKALCMVSDQNGWEHVRVSVGKSRAPNWHVMEALKNVFWASDDVVMQLHLPPDSFKNPREHIMHLWRPVDGGIPVPPPICLGHNPGDAIHTLTCRLIRQNKAATAYLVEFDNDHQEWFPAKCVELVAIDDQLFDLHCPQWLLDKKGIRIVAKESAA